MYIFYIAQRVALSIKKQHFFNEESLEFKQNATEIIKNNMLMPVFIKAILCVSVKLL